MPNKKDTHVYKRLQMIDEIIGRATFPSREKLAKEVSASPRTIIRDINYMKDELGIPIKYDRTRKGYYYTQKGYFIKNISMSEGELFYVSLFENLLHQYKNTPLENQLKSIINKISAVLPDQVQVQSNFMSKDITYISEPVPEINQEVFNIILDCLKTRTSLQIDYRKLGSTNALRRTIDPYHMVYFKGSWYIFAYCHLRNEIREFSLTRILGAVKTENHFEIPKDFDVKTHIDPNFGVFAKKGEPIKIKLKCTGYLCDRVQEKKLHENQKTIRCPEENSVIVEFETNQEYEVQKLILGLGPEAKVLEPPELAQKIKEMALKIASRY